MPQPAITKIRLKMTYLKFNQNFPGVNELTITYSKRAMSPYYWDYHANNHMPLTHWPLDKMAANLADNIFNRIFLNENAWISIKISLKFVPKGPIDKKPELVQVMGCRRTGDKPLSEPMLTRFTDAYMRH